MQSRYSRVTAVNSPHKGPVTIWWRHHGQGYTWIVFWGLKSGMYIYIYNLFKPLMCCTQYFVKMNLPIVTFYNIFNVSYWYRGISWVHSDLKHFDLHNLYVYALICWFDVLTNDYSYHVQKKCHNRKVIFRWHSGYSNPRIAGIEDSVGSTRGWRHYFWTVTSREGFL